VNARVSADVVIGGQELSSTVVYQNSRSRAWIQMINSGGCKQMYGNALTFKLANDRVLTIPSRMCHKAQQVLAERGQVDILNVCAGERARTGSAFVVDSALRPSMWRRVVNAVDFHISRMTAVSTWSHPTDDIATVAPGLLKSRFRKDGRVSWDSPEKIIPFRRRYDRDKGFKFQVDYENFSVE